MTLVGLSKTRDDLQSFGYDTPVTLIRPDSYTTLLDATAGHLFLRELGFTSVVVVGHSGGASLAAYYIEQAALPSGQRVGDSPGGKPIPLGEALMPLPDGLMLMAPHPGQGELLARMIDPSVADESDPLSVVSSLDPYDPSNGFQPPPQPSSYSPDFIDAYRQAQYRRVERIDAVARHRIERSERARKRYRDTVEARYRRESLATEVITVHRTDADLRSVDLSLDPNDRPYGSLFGSRPDLTNYGIVGFARLTTPQAWLSTWLAISSRANLRRCAASVTLPVLLIELTGDQACFPADAEAMVGAFAGDDTTHVRVAGMHFGGALREGSASGAALAGQAMAQWLDKRYPATGYDSRGHGNMLC